MVISGRGRRFCSGQLHERRIVPVVAVLHKPHGQQLSRKPTFTSIFQWQSVFPGPSKPAESLRTGRGLPERPAKWKCWQIKTLTNPFLKRPLPLESFRVRDRYACSAPPW
ncbi:hypothetical protein Pla52n_14420 [Stieleria varia]|uniref:Uncharacterized protein n=1 Tax=Stieleria varia TaxID=2528005 RepID=A0A5C6B1M3_9BACT|nr:hypothetical protein Pla52n_14420 [Stieleria varia]